MTIKKINAMPRNKSQTLRTSMRTSISKILLRSNEMSVPKIAIKYDSKVSYVRPNKPK